MARHLPRIGFRAKLLLAFAIVLLPILALLFVNFQASLESERDSTLGDQQLTAQAVAVQVDEAFDAAVGIGWAVANDPLVKTMDPARLDPHLQRLAAQHPMYDAINVFDAQGSNRGWGQLTEPAEPRLNIADRPYFQRVMATNAPTISDVILLRRPEAVGIIATVPIRDEADRPIGVVNVVMRTDQLASRYEHARLLPGQAILLADRTGRLAFHTGIPGLTFEQSDDFIGFEPLRQALSGTAVQVPQFITPILGDVRLGAFVPTPRYQWVVGVTMPRAVALAPVQQAFRDQMLAFVGLLLLSSGLAIVLARLFVEPVRRLARGARALGRGELSRRVTLHTGDELEELGESFNEMAAQLEQRQAEVQRLRTEAERRAGQLAAIIASMTDAVFIASADGRLVDSNPAAARLLGAETGITLGLPLDEYFRRHDLRRLDGRPLAPEESALRRAIAGEAFSGLEARLRTLQGEERIVSCSGAPVHNEAGDIILGVVVAHDITEERGREQETEALGEIARSLVHELELNRVAEVVMDQSLRVLGADAVLLHLADPVRRELTLLAQRNLPASMEAEERVIPYDAPLLSARAATEGRLQTVEDLAKATLAHPAREAYDRGGFRSLLAVPLFSRGSIVGVLTHLSRRPRRFSRRSLEFNTTVADLFAVAIENAHLYDELRDALRLREEFIAAAAHELKTPVTVIKGWAQMLLATNAQSAQQRRALQTIDRQADRVGRLIEDVLAVSTLRPGVPPEAKERFDLAEAVETTVHQASRFLEGYRFAVKTEGPLPVETDRRLVIEVLNRLLENAARYSPSGGIVEVEARQSGGQAIVAVRDHGFGIAPERQKHVFEPFYQPVPPGVPGYVGAVSLGLHLSKQIIEALGGRIWITSTPGEGSIFSFSLPLAADAPRQQRGGNRIAS